VNDIHHKVSKIHEEMASLLEDFFRLERPMNIAGERMFAPSADVYETEKEIVVRAELAGVKDKDIFVSIQDNRLLIRGFRREDEAPKGEKRSYHKMEISVGPFKRNIHLPCEVNPGEMKMTYKLGVLEVRVQKAKVKRVKAIEIKIQ
jgi:HSP20 family protein